MSREEALSFLMFELVSRSDKDTIKRLMENKSVPNNQGLTLLEQVKANFFNEYADVLRSEYGDDMERLKADLNNLLVAMNEYYFDA